MTSATEQKVQESILKHMVDKYGPISTILDVLESGESLYLEEQKAFGPNFSNYKWQRAQRVHMDNISRLKSLLK